MTKPTRTEITNYMENNLEDHRDAMTGEINATTLAEDAWTHLSDDPERDIHPFYENAAYRIATRDTRLRTGNLFPSGLGSMLIGSKDASWF